MNLKVARARLLDMPFNGMCVLEIEYLHAISFYSSEILQKYVFFVYYEYVLTEKYEQLLKLVVLCE